MAGGRKSEREEGGWRERGREKKRKRESCVVTLSHHDF